MIQFIFQKSLVSSCEVEILILKFRYLGHQETQPTYYRLVRACIVRYYVGASFIKEISASIHFFSFQKFCK